MNADKLAALAKLEEIAARQSDVETPAPQIDERPKTVRSMTREERNTYYRERYKQRLQNKTHIAEIEWLKDIKEKEEIEDLKQRRLVRKLRSVERRIKKTNAYYRKQKRKRFLPHDMKCTHCGNGPFTSRQFVVKTQSELVVYYNKHNKRKAKRVTKPTFIGCLKCWRQKENLSCV